MLQRRKSPSSKLEKDPGQVHRQQQASSTKLPTTEVTPARCQPDMVISEYTKHLFMLELMVPWEENERMGAKYEELVEERQGTLSPRAKLQRNHEVAVLKRADPRHATGKHARTWSPRLARLGEGVWCCETQNTQWTQETSLMTRPSTSMRYLFPLDRGGSEQ